MDLDHDYFGLALSGRLRKYAANMEEEVKRRDEGSVPLDRYRDKMEFAAKKAAEAADAIERLRNAQGSSRP